MQKFALSFPHLSDHRSPFGTYWDIADHADTILYGNHMGPCYIRIPLCAVNDSVAGNFNLLDKAKTMKLPSGSGAYVRFANLHCCVPPARSLRL
jgi:hypothetical protein